MLLQMVLGNPMVEFALASLPGPLRAELRELRSMAMSGELSFAPRRVHRGEVGEGQAVRGVAVCLGAVRAGSVAGVNFVRGDLSGGTLRGVNVLQGDVRGGQAMGLNVLAGTVYDGRVSAVNLVLGDVRGGRVSRAAVVVGDIYGGTVQTEMLLGRIFGGEVQARHHVGGGSEKDAPSDSPGASPPGSFRAHSPEGKGEEKNSA